MDIKVETDVVQILKEIQAHIKSVEENTTKNTHLLVGIDGDNGLRSQVKELIENQRKHEIRMDKIEAKVSRSTNIVYGIILAVNALLVLMEVYKNYFS